MFPVGVALQFELENGKSHVGESGYSDRVPKCGVQMKYLHKGHWTACYLQLWASSRKIYRIGDCLGWLTLGPRGTHIACMCLSIASSASMWGLVNIVRANT